MFVRLPSLWIYLHIEVSQVQGLEIRQEIISLVLADIHFDLAFDVPVFGAGWLGFNPAVSTAVAKGPSRRSSFAKFMADVELLFPAVLTITHGGSWVLGTALFTCVICIKYILQKDPKGKKKVHKLVVLFFASNFLVRPLGFKLKPVYYKKIAVISSVKRL